MLTVDNLKKGGVGEITLTNRCELCKSSEESRAHLFLECRYTKPIWRYFWDCAGAIPYFDGDLVSMLKQKGSIGLSRLGKLNWPMLFHAITWVVWFERNRQCFEGKEMNSMQVINKVKHLIWSWGLVACEGRKTKLEEIMFAWDKVTRS